MQRLQTMCGLAKDSIAELFPNPMFLPHMQGIQRNKNMGEGKTTHLSYTDFM